MTKRIKLQGTPKENIVFARKLFDEIENLEA